MCKDICAQTIAVWHHYRDTHRCTNAVKYLSMLTEIHVQNKTHLLMWCICVHLHVASNNKEKFWKDDYDSAYA